MQQWLALLRSQLLTALLSVNTDWGFSAASCGSHCRPSEESRSLVCAGLQCCSQRAAWPLSAALSYLSRACPDSQPGLPRHKGGLVLGETGVSNPPPPSSRWSRQMPAATEPHIWNWATWKEGSSLPPIHSHHIARDRSPISVWERSCQIWSIHQRRLSQSKSITDWGCVLTDWHTDWQLYCVLWGTGMKGSHEEALQTQTILSRAREESLVPLYALLLLCVESTSFSWQHSFSNTCTKATMEESDTLYSDYKALRTQESGIWWEILFSLLASFHENFIWQFFSSVMAV